MTYQVELFTGLFADDLIRVSYQQDPEKEGVEIEVTVVTGEKIKGCLSPEKDYIMMID